MSTPVPSDPTPSSTSSDAASAEGFEFLHEFWRKYSRVILLLCAIAFVVIVGREAIKWYSHHRQRELADAYAAAGTTEKLKTFAEKHSGTELAGAAHLRIADEAYAAGNFSDAAAAYERASGVFKNGALAGRAMIGLAISKIGAGQTAEGKEKLVQIAADAAQLKTTRAEAYYHLASLALAAGKTEEASKALEQLTSVDPAGTWAQRGLALRATLPVAAPSAETPADASVKIQLPGQP